MALKVLDRRVDKTRHALRSAFTKLVLEHRFDEITVPMIVAEANVGKSTFYEHFRNKNDILKDAMGGMLQALADSAAKDCDAARLRSLVAHFWTNRRLSKAVFAPPLVAELQRCLAAMIERNLVARRAAAGPRLAALRLSATHIAAGHFGLLIAWLTGEIAAEQDEVVAALRNMAFPELSGRE